MPFRLNADDFYYFVVLAPTITAGRKRSFKSAVFSKSSLDKFKLRSCFSLIQAGKKHVVWVFLFLFFKIFFLNTYC